MIERRGLGIRLISTVSILGMFGVLALVKWLGSSGYEGEGLASSGIGSSTGAGWILLLGVGLVLGVLRLRSGLRSALATTRRGEIWLGRDEPGGFQVPVGEAAAWKAAVQWDHQPESEERIWVAEPAEWMVGSEIVEEGAR